MDRGDLVLENKTLVVMVGLPRSGKSTKARGYNCPIVSGDAIRLALHGTPYIELLEPLVDYFKQRMIVALFASGHECVVVDDCHLTEAGPQPRHPLRSLAGRVMFDVVDTPAEECKARALLTEQEYLVPVIDLMVSYREPVSDEKGRLIPWQ